MLNKQIVSNNRKLYKYADKYLSACLSTNMHMKHFVSRKYFSTKFNLPKDFVDGYRSRPVKFGFNGLGEIAYIRTYSRQKEDGSNEEWADTVERIVNG